jgi:sodium/pantothenate symporter
MAELPLELPASPGWGVLAALVLVIGFSMWLGMAAQKVVERGTFLKGYFLGNRSLGVWAMALTATVQSGGTFMGFPSLVYSHGWILALWIGSYMIVPLTGFAVLGKRFAQLSRRTGALTVPDLFRGRFDRPVVGLVASLLIMLFMAVMMVAQFKAGAIVMKLSLPGLGHSLALTEELTSGPDRAYYIGLTVFTITVVGYTMIGGFLASVWTDLFQSVLMLAGVIVLLCLSLPLAGGLQQATLTAVEHAGPEFVFGPGHTHGGGEFLPLGMAVSFFFVWIFGGMASPASLVRVMASSETATLRRSIFVLSAYNSMIYIPLIAICVAARAIMPDLGAAHSDEVIPRMALLTTSRLPGGSLLAGLILSAPFGAVMATVSSYLVVIASGAVHDIYQRYFDRSADEKRLRTITYCVTVMIGVGAAAANIWPVTYLQALVVFCTSSGAAAFLVPAMMAAYWRRATAAGALAAMLGGSLTVLTLFVIGRFEPSLVQAGWLAQKAPIGPATSFHAYYLAGMEPAVWGLAASCLLGILVSLMTRPPSADVISRMFDAEE